MNPDSSRRPNSVIGEVRYSLPELLEGLKAERNNATVAMEKLDQTEIGKMFKAKLPRRVKPKS
jgi:hypothetical protein